MITSSYPRHLRNLNANAHRINENTSMLRARLTGLLETVAYVQYLYTLQPQTLSLQ